MTLLAVRHASLGYSRHPVLRDVSFTLSQGTICCLLGANGCGKTTLMRSILGVIPLLKGYAICTKPQFLCVSVGMAGS